MSFKRRMTACFSVKWDATLPTYPSTSLVVSGGVGGAEWTAPGQTAPLKQGA